MKASIILTFIFSIGCLAGFSQDKKDGKITVEITKEINGEKRTFKGEYDNVEQMRADPNYQEFAGEDNSFNFWFDGDGDDEDLFMRLDQLDHFGRSFNFNFRSLDPGLQGFNLFKNFNGDSSDQSSRFFRLDDWEADEESIDQLQNRMQELLERLDEKQDAQVYVFKKRIEVKDVDGNEFGKKGEVSENNLLVLDDLSFYPNPSSDGRFKVRFRVPEENELTIKVFNIEGKEVFNRYFERFGGLYSESIDLSGQKEGIYLLEISQGKKRLTKKIVIN